MHGIIYDRGQELPTPLADEPELGVATIQLENDYNHEKLQRESRVNYGKQVTISHSAKVYFIGRVADTDMEIVNNAVDDCWEAKYKTSARKHQRRVTYTWRSGAGRR